MSGITPIEKNSGEEVIVGKPSTNGTTHAPSYMNSVKSFETLHIENEVPDTQPAEKQSGMLYTVNDIPPVHISVLLGFQHFLTMFGSNTIVPFIIGPALCIADDDPARGALFSTVIFVTGISSFLQTTFGLRLPVVEGASAGFIVPVFTVLSLYKCASPQQLALMSEADRIEDWQFKIRLISGSLMIAAFGEMLLGLLGIVGIMFRFITPIAISATVILVGISLVPFAGDLAETHWGMAIVTILLIMLFSQYLPEVPLPCPGYSFKKRSCTSTKAYVFKLFPVLFAIGIAWGICTLLTITEALPKTSSMRTDARLNAVEKAPWFFVPYPGQFGIPTVSLAAVFGLFAGAIASVVESMGDYYACAKLAGGPPPPIHALNRAVLFDGISSFFGGAFGCCLGMTTFSENVAAIAITKVGSRRVLQAGAIVMMLFGCFGKFGALFVCIPDPIIGGVYICLIGLISAIGISLLQYVDLDSSRNLFIIGFSIVFPIALASFVKAHPEAIQTGSELLDQILNVLFGTSMFMGGIIGMLLDNTVPGTNAERGMDKWLAHLESATNARDDQTNGKQTNYCYEPVSVVQFCQRNRWTHYIPILPSFPGWRKLLSKQL